MKVQNKWLSVLSIIMLTSLMGPMSLHSMELHPYYALPKELQQEIVNKALETSNSVDQVINSIKKFGVVYKVPYTTQAAVDLLMKSLPNDLKQAVEATKNLQGTKPQDFTKLVHILVDKFNTSPYEVALLFNTPIAEEYLELADQWGPSSAFKPLIAQGADVNFYGDENYFPTTLLNDVIGVGQDIESVKLLLAAGANPLLKDSQSRTAFDQLSKSIEFYNKLKSERGLYEKQAAEALMKLETIKRLLEEAIEKQSTAAK